jgi:outer membrane lipoprotein LolB
MSNMKMNPMTYVMGLLVLGCSGCGTSPSQHSAPKESIPFIQRHKTVNQLNAFKVSGKVGFIRENKGGSASLDWTQQGTQYLVRLYGPFGSESVSLRGNAEHIILTRSNGQRMEASKPETLVQKALGLDIPVSGLRYWLKGVPAPGNLARSPIVNADGLITEFEQDGWIIRYDGYTHYNHPTLKSLLK